MYCASPDSLLVDTEVVYGISMPLTCPSDRFPVLGSLRTASEAVSEADWTEAGDPGPAGGGCSVLPRSGVSSGLRLCAAAGPETVQFPPASPRSPPSAVPESRPGRHAAAAGGAATAAAGLSAPAERPPAGHPPQTGPEPACPRHTSTGGQTADSAQYRLSAVALASAASGTPPAPTGTVPGVPGPSGGLRSDCTCPEPAHSGPPGLRLVRHRHRPQPAPGG